MKPILSAVTAVTRARKSRTAGRLACLCLALAGTIGQGQAQSPDIRVKKKAYTLLVTPAYGNDYATVRKRPVYLPAGKWQDWETGILYTGPQTLPDHDFPLDKIPAFIGGQGVVVTQEQQGLQATVYPVAPRGTDFVFTYPDGRARSRIEVANRGWNSGSLKITDTSTGQPVAFTYLEKHKAFSFALTPRHDYRLEGGN